MRLKIWKMNFRRLTDKYVEKIDKMVEDKIKRDHDGVNRNTYRRGLLNQGSLLHGSLPGRFEMQRPDRYPGDFRHLPYG